MGKRLGGFLPRPRLIPEIDGNCSGGREKGQGCVKELRNRIKPMIPVGYVSKERRLLIAGELVVPTCQTSGHAGLQGSGSSRLLGATGRRGQPNSTVNSLKTARNPLILRKKANAGNPGPTLDDLNCSGYDLFLTTKSKVFQSDRHLVKIHNFADRPPERETRHAHHKSRLIHHVHRDCHLGQGNMDFPQRDFLYKSRFLMDPEPVQLNQNYYDILYVN